MLNLKIIVNNFLFKILIRTNKLLIIVRTRKTVRGRKELELNPTKSKKTITVRI